MDRKTDILNRYGIINSFVEWNSSNFVFDGKLLCGECIFETINASIAVFTGDVSKGCIGQAEAKKLIDFFKESERRKLHSIVIYCSSGMNIDEGVNSVIQMTRITGQIEHYKKKGFLYISIFDKYIYGGVLASFGSTADLRFAIRNTNIGLCGNIIHKKLFGNDIHEYQTDSYQLNTGLLSKTINIDELYSHIKYVLTGNRIVKQKKLSQIDFAGSLSDIETCFSYVRSMEKIYSSELLRVLFNDFIEIQGNSSSSDSKEIICGFGFIQKQKYAVIAQENNRNSFYEFAACNYGMTSPKGYKKATIFLKLAERMRIPVLLFVDTVGAQCDAIAESYGQVLFLRDFLVANLNLSVPNIAIVLGEAESGGAIPFFSTNKILSVNNAFLSTISPEAYCAIKKENIGYYFSNPNVTNNSLSYLKQIGLIDHFFRLSKNANHFDTTDISNLQNLILFETNQFYNKSRWHILHNRFKKWKDIRTYG